MCVTEEYVMRTRVWAALFLLPFSIAAQTPPAPTPLSINLADALARARAYSPQFLTAGLAASSAHEDKLQAKAALLPTLNAFNQYIYTQGNGTPSGIFVANDGVHIYNEQATVHADLFSVTRLADYRRTIAAEAAARARQDVARRGLAITVIQNYYAVVAMNRRLANARQSLADARRFEDITQKQEAGGEAAHADVVKAQIQLQQRERDVTEAQASVDKAKIGLAVLLFQNLDQAYNVVDDLNANAPLSPAGDVRQQAFANNPDLAAAQATVNQARYSVKAARGEYVPSLALDYFYGIDANVFGITGPYDRQNLGSVVQATVNVPVWNWGATRSRVRQSELARQQAQNDLTFTQRQIQASVDAFYVEAQTARAQLDSLRSSRDLAEESVRLTLLRYQAGEASALEVVDAQTTLVDARNAYDDGLTRYRLALANLETLTGRY
jgi:outer membrane protein